VKTLSAILIAVMALQPLAVSAQADTAAVWRTFASNLEVGARITVRLLDGGRVSATLVQAAPEGLLIQPRTRATVPVQSVPYERVASIERDSPGLSAGRAALIGVAAGAAAFFGIMLIVIANAMD
jgi:hypothetical protein